MVNVSIHGCEAQLGHLFSEQRSLVSGGGYRHISQGQWWSCMAVKKIVLALGRMYREERVICEVVKMNFRD